MTGCHTNTAKALLSACHEAPVKTLPIQADLSWSPLPHVRLCTTAFSFSCPPLCPSSNRVLSLLIAFDIRLFLLILRPLSSKLLFARLPHGNLGEPNTKHTLCSLRIWCCPDATTLSSALTTLCLFSYLSSLLPCIWLACCGLRRFLFHRLQTGVALRLFSSTCTKLPNSSTCPSFWTTAPAPIPINFSHTTTVGPSSSLQNFRSPRPAD